MRVSAADRRRGKDMAHMVIRYVVPPSETENFIESWRDAADRLQEEKGAVIYTLRKVGGGHTSGVGFSLRHQT
jgi:hypothetical protein